MADHSAFKELAIRLIAEHGRPVTVRELSAGPADPDKPWLGAGVPVTLSEVADVPAVFVPASGSSLGRDIVHEDLLKKVEQVALVSPNEQGWERMHQVVDGGTTWKIEWAQALQPADLTVLYVFGLVR